MPILDIEIVARPDESFSPTLAAELANRAGEVFGAPPGNTWVKLRSIAREHYAENGSPPPSDIYPVFVSILKAEVPAPDALRAEVANLTEAIAQVCGRPPDNVHIIYLPAGAGRVAFGGKIVP